MRLAISDRHSGLVAALKRAFQGTAHERCRVHFAFPKIGPGPGSWASPPNDAAALYDLLDPWDVSTSSTCPTCWRLVRGPLTADSDNMVVVATTAAR